MQIRQESILKRLRRFWVNKNILFYSKKVLFNGMSELLDILGSMIILILEIKERKIGRWYFNGIL